MISFSLEKTNTSQSKAALLFFYEHPPGTFQRLTGFLLVFLLVFYWFFTWFYWVLLCFNGL